SAQIPTVIDCAYRSGAGCATGCCSSCCTHGTATSEPGGRWANHRGDGNGNHQLCTRSQSRAAVAEAVMHFLDPLPVHVAALFHLLQPGQVRVGLNHGIDGLAHGVLVDMLDIDLQPFHGFDGQFALGDQLALDQGFVGVTLALGALPGPAALALLVAFLVQVLDAFEADGAAADQFQIGAAAQCGGLVGLVTSADQRQVTPCGDLGALLSDPGNLVATERFAPEGAFALLFVEAVIQVFSRQQGHLVARHQIGFAACLQAAGRSDQVVTGEYGEITTSLNLTLLLGDPAGFTGNLLVAAPVAVDVVLFVGST